LPSVVMAYQRRVMRLEEPIPREVGNAAEAIPAQHQDLHLGHYAVYVLLVLKTRGPFFFAAWIIGASTGTKLRPSLGPSFMETCGNPRERTLPVEDTSAEVKLLTSNKLKLTSRHVLIHGGKPLLEFVQC